MSQLGDGAAVGIVEAAAVDDDEVHFPLGVHADAGAGFHGKIRLGEDLVIPDQHGAAAEGVYGEGLAGDMWKSQLSERLADVMAARGGIGIARQMLADHYMEGKRAVPVGPVSGGPERAGIDQQTSLSASLVQQVERRVVRSLDDDPAAVATAGRVSS